MMTNSVLDDPNIILDDRLTAIRNIINKYGQENFYLAFSGGKDSTILHHLIDMALPDNDIPRVYCDTGIEYLMVRSFVRSLVKVDARFKIIYPSIAIKAMLEKFGYPFKSKEHSQRVYEFNRNPNAPFLKRYITGIDKNGDQCAFSCPKCLLYQFAEKGKYNYSHLCCFNLKKRPFKAYSKASGRKIVLTGMRKSEGGNRINLRCAVYSKDGSLAKFHPLSVVDDEWESWFIDSFGIRLCDLYYPPFNFKRTGCKGCPFSLDLQEQLTLMQRYLPYEREQCEFIWKPVYDEYRRIGYRLVKKEQLRLF